MAAPRGRGLRIGGVLRALGRLSLLVGLGFGVGLVIGVVAEEPTLLYGHLTGGGQSVALTELRVAGGSASNEAADPASSDSPLDAAGGIDRIDPSRVADRPVGTLVQRDSMKDKVKDEPREVRLPAVSAAAPTREPSSKSIDRVSPNPTSVPHARPEEGGQWAIQVGAFSDEAAARRLVKSLAAKDYPVAIVPSSGSSQRWRVRVQPVHGEERARSMANRLKREERLPTWLISLEAGASR